MPLWRSRKDGDERLANLSDLSPSETETESISKHNTFDFATVMKEPEQIALFREFLTEEFSLENLLVRILFFIFTMNSS